MAARYCFNGLPPGVNRTIVGPIVMVAVSEMSVAAKAASARPSRLIPDTSGTRVSFPAQHEVQSEQLAVESVRKPINHIAVR
jgi:hypothetical protein